MQFKGSILEILVIHES